MTIQASILAPIVEAIFSHQATIAVPNGSITVSQVSGAPSHLTMGELGTAFTLAMVGVADSITCGNICLKYTPNP